LHNKKSFYLVKKIGVQLMGQNSLSFEWLFVRQITLKKYLPKILFVSIDPKKLAI